MKKGDFVWILLLAGIVFVLLNPETNFMYKSANKSFPFVVGFTKFFVLATMGELLSLRIISGEWKAPGGIVWRAIIWGFLGMVIVVVFDVFSKGITDSMQAKMLPGYGNSWIFAFFTSTIMNLTFAPTMMAFHRVTDTYLDLYYETRKFPDLQTVVSHIHWNRFVSFVVCKTIPLFWIPAHTITFLLPGDYRVLMAGFLSMALGGILGFAKKREISRI